MTREWYFEERPHKQVVLCNVEECKDLTASEVSERLRGLGYCKWETYMGLLMTEAIKVAKERKEKTANITKMFSCDLVGVDDIGDYRKKQKNVISFILEKLFDVVSETEDELKVTFKATTK